MEATFEIPIVLFENIHNCLYIHITYQLNIKLQHARKRSSQDTDTLLLCCAALACLVKEAVLPSDTWQVRLTSRRNPKDRWNPVNWGRFLYLNIFKKNFFPWVMPRRWDTFLDFSAMTEWRHPWYRMWVCLNRSPWDALFIVFSPLRRGWT